LFVCIRALNRINRLLLKTSNQIEISSLEDYPDFYSQFVFRKSEEEEREEKERGMKHPQFNDFYRCTPVQIHSIFMLLLVTEI